MTKKCFICKAEPSPICERSFHMFPKNESMKNKWLNALNVLKTLNFKTTYICSDHFDTESFIDFDEWRQKKRLCKEAVPTLEKENLPNFSRENKKELAIISINDCEEENVKLKKSLQMNTNEIKTDKDNVLTNCVEFQKSNYLQDASLKSHLHEDIEISQNNIPNIDSIDSEKSDVTKDSNSQSGTENITERHTHELSSNNPGILNGNCKKRKKTFSDTRTAKMVRYMNGFTTEYISQKDFVSEEAWNRFLRCIAYQRSLTAAAHNKNSRKQKKIKNLTGLISTLEKRDEFSVAQYLKELPPHIIELLTRMKDRKSTARFPDKLRTFARTLHFHSPAAYEVVRRSFLKCLPTVQTINSWTCSKEYKPGISEKTISKVSDIVMRESIKGKKLVFNLTFDEMNIQQHREWDKNLHSWKGLVDVGGQLHELNVDGEQKIATKALVFMLVNINGQFKVPIAHYLINSLTGIEKAILIKDLLIKLDEKKIHVVSVTFDGDSAHRTACESLGANLNYRVKENFKPYFEHPISLNPIYIFYDPCHCLKLIRNYFATKGPIIYDGQYIHWGFIKKLQKIQESTKLHFACKIGNKHVNFYKEKMKVYLAAQVLSRSVSIALTLLEFNYKDQDFQHASSTAKFCENFNNIFDLLNVRSKFGKTPTRMNINKYNLEEVKQKIDQYIEYIEKLEINVKLKSRKTNPNRDNLKISKDVNSKYDTEIDGISTNSELTVRKSVLHSDSVRTGFVGFIICLKNLYSLANFLIHNSMVEYLLTYKLSQDHIEMFFSSIRRMNGFNNNPTTTQYNSAYKKLLLNKLDIVTSSWANCTPLDQTLLLPEDISITEDQSMYTDEKLIKNNQEVTPTTKKRIPLHNITNMQSEHINFESSKICNTKVTCPKNHDIKRTKSKLIVNVGDFLKNENYHIFEHTYTKTENESWCFSEYSEDIVKHTAGAIARILSSEIHCDKCRNLLLDTKNSTNKSQLTEAKDYGGLKYASYDVNFICKCTERTIRKQTYLVTKNINAQLITETLQILPNSILDDDEHFLEQELFMDHRHQLILMIIQKYIDIRLKHEGKLLNDTSQRIRMHNNKLTIFKGQ